MEQQQKIDIAARLRDLRDNSVETNRSIGDHVGVGERSVANWMAGDTGMKYENAVAVAELFDVSVNWLWAGDEEERGPTPDPFARNGLSPLDSMLTEIAARLRSIEEA